MNKKQSRGDVITQVWSQRSVPDDFDFIDRGDHLKVTTAGDDGERVTAWWLGTLRARYPQDQCSGTGDVLKMRPSPGVTLQINRCDGTLRIRGKRHLEWFKDNFEQLLETGGADMMKTAAFNKALTNELGLDDGHTVEDLLQHLPPTGAIKHGPTYIYRLWRGLLDRWIGDGEQVYIVTPLMDARRLSEIILMLIKERLARSNVHMMTMPKCDGDSKFPKVFKQAKETIKAMKGPGKRRLVSDERFMLGAERLEARFSGFHCKFIAVIRGDRAEVLTTSANFHKWHFEVDNGDMISYFRMSKTDLRKHYLEPLGLARPVSVVQI